MTPRREQDTTFVPRGAIAFFFAMIAIYAALWLALYYVMAHRG